MSQIESGVRKVLACPAIYNVFQLFMGASAIRREFVNKFVQPCAGQSVLDIGCGTAELLKYLPEGVKYFGFDQSADYINHAKRVYGTRGQFHCSLVDELSVGKLPKMDIVIASGLLHHLDDTQAAYLLKLASSVLTTEGRFVAIDPCYHHGQSRVAKWLIDRDRGENVRTMAQYAELAEPVFGQVTSVVCEREWVPYTHNILVCLA